MNMIHKLLMILIFFFYGCTNLSLTKNEKIEPDINLPNKYKYQEKNDTDSKYISLENLANWWQLWNDDNLNYLIKEGLNNNLTIKQVKENYNQILGIYGIVKAELFPVIGLNSSFKNNNIKFHNDDFFNSPYINVDNNIEVMYQNLTLGAKWEPDIFGKKTKNKNASYYQTLTVKELIYTTQLIVTSLIAENYLYAAYLQEQIKVLDDSIKNIKKQIRYVEGRFNSGLTTADKINEAKANLYDLQAKKEPLLSQYQSVESLIATLIGKNPESFELKLDSNIIYKKLPIPRGSIPSDLLTRRPDLRARQNFIKSLSYKLGASKTEIFPSFYINFLANAGRISFKDLGKMIFTGPFLDIGMNLPIFTAGKILSNIFASKSALKAAIKEYENAVLIALAQVDSLYYARYMLDRNNTNQLQSLKYYQIRKKQQEKLFEKSFSTYNDVIMNQFDLLKTKDKYIKFKLINAIVTILLYQSLGGGW